MKLSFELWLCVLFLARQSLATPAPRDPKDIARVPAPEGFPKVNISAIINQTDSSKIGSPKKTFHPTGLKVNLSAFDEPSAALPAVKNSTRYYVNLTAFKEPSAALPPVNNFIGLKVNLTAFKEPSAALPPTENSTRYYVNLTALKEPSDALPDVKNSTRYYVNLTALKEPSAAQPPVKNFTGLKVNLTVFNEPSDALPLVKNFTGIAPHNLTIASTNPAPSQNATKPLKPHPIHGPQSIFTAVMCHHKKDAQKSCNKPYNKKWKTHDQIYENIQTCPSAKDLTLICAPVRWDISEAGKSREVPVSQTVLAGIEHLKGQEFYEALNRTLGETFASYAVNGNQWDEKIPTCVDENWKHQDPNDDNPSPHILFHCGESWQGEDSVKFIDAVRLGANSTMYELAFTNQMDNDVNLYKDTIPNLIAGMKDLTPALSYKKMCDYNVHYPLKVETNAGIPPYLHPLPDFDSVTHIFPGQDEECGIFEENTKNMTSTEANLYLCDPENEDLTVLDRELGYYIRFEEWSTHYIRFWKDETPVYGPAAALKMQCREYMEKLEKAEKKEAKKLETEEANRIKAKEKERKRLEKAARDQAKAEENERKKIEDAAKKQAKAEEKERLRLEKAEADRVKKEEAQLEKDRKELERLTAKYNEMVEKLGDNTDKPHIDAVDQQNGGTAEQGALSH